MNGKENDLSSVPGGLQLVNIFNKLNAGSFGNFHV